MTFLITYLVALVTCSTVGLLTWRVIWQLGMESRYVPLPIPIFIEDVPVTTNSNLYIGGFV